MALFSFELEIIPNKISSNVCRDIWIVRRIKPPNDLLYEWFDKGAIDKWVVDWVIFPTKAAFTAPLATERSQIYF